MASSPFTPSSDSYLASSHLRDTLDLSSQAVDPDRSYPVGFTSGLLDPSSSSNSLGSASTSLPDPTLPTPTHSSRSTPTNRIRTTLHPILAAIPPGYHSLLSGAGAGLISATLTCPLDVLKTRLQAQIHQRGSTGYEGVRETAGKIWRQSGVKGFYRGLGPTVLGYLPTWGIYFSVYDEVKGRLGDGQGDSSGMDWSIHILAAMTAGATGTIVTNPLWVIKTRFMAQAVIDPKQPRYRNTLEAARTIYRNEGIRAFYKGLAPSLLGVSHVAVQFPLYEQLKVWATPPDNSPLQSKTILLCSATSKMCASLVTYPHEVLRTRLQIQKTEQRKLSNVSAEVKAVSRPISSDVSRSTTTARPSASTPPESIDPTSRGPKRRMTPGGPALVHSAPPSTVSASTSTATGLILTARSIWANDGWKGFYRGITVNLFRTIPAAAMTMLTYELIMRSFAEG